jgi:hypothetical protein
MFCDQFPGVILANILTRTDDGGIEALCFLDAQSCPGKVFNQSQIKWLPIK